MLKVEEKSQLPWQMLKVEEKKQLPWQMLKVEEKKLATNLWFYFLFKV